MFPFYISRNDRRKVISSPTNFSHIAHIGPDQVLIDLPKVSVFRLVTCKFSIEYVQQENNFFYLIYLMLFNLYIGNSLDPAKQYGIPI